MATSKLHADGKYTKGEAGNIVYLRGTNRGHFEDGPTGGWGGFTIFLEEDCEMELDYMQSKGFNVIRVYTQIDYWKNNTPGNIGGGETLPHRDIVKTIIEKANERGIYIIYCPWSVAASKQDPLPYPPRTTHPEVIGSEQEFIDYWVTVVNELKGYPNVMWEIWNEPNPGSDPGLDAWGETWQDVIDAIRNTGDDHIIITGYCANISYLPGWGPVFSNWVFNPYPTLRFNDPEGNLVYAGHIYPKHDSFWDGSERKYLYDDVKAMMQADTMQIKRIGDEWNLPMVIGEIGPGSWAGDELFNLCVKNCLTVFNEWGLGYTTWDWHKCGEWTMFTDVWLGQGGPTPNAAGQILLDAIAAGAGTYSVNFQSNLAGESIPIYVDRQPIGQTPCSKTDVEFGTTLSVYTFSTWCTPKCYKLDHWEKDGVNIGGDDPISVSISANCTLKAVFVRA